MRGALLLLCVVPGLCLADIDPQFAKLRDQALEQGGAIEGLGTWLDKYIGECSELGAGRECQQNAKNFRAIATGKKFYLIVNEDDVNQLSPGPWDPRGRFVVNLTPFFPAAGYALTGGAPHKTDAEGHPLVPLIPVMTPTPDGWNAGTFGRMISMHTFKMQLVFTPEGVWSLPKKGGGKIYGVKAKIDGVFIESARTGRPLSVYVSKR